VERCFIGVMSTTCILHMQWYDGSPHRSSPVRPRSSPRHCQSSASRLRRAQHRRHGSTASTPDCCSPPRHLQRRAASGRQHDGPPLVLAGERRVALVLAPLHQRHGLAGGSLRGQREVGGMEEGPLVGRLGYFCPHVARRRRRRNVPYNLI
jgi:hypothetical protein